MIADTYMVPEGDVYPGSFGGLMALYESNYIKLIQLLGELRTGEFRAVSSADGDLPLYMTQEARDANRYTVDLRLTYVFSESGSSIADPDLCVRLYLDARMAEVRGWARHHRHGVLLHLRERYGRELDRRWSRNTMLGKWLEYLLEQGHTFVTTSAPEAAEATV